MGKTLLSFAAAAALATVFVASPASANLVTNGSFETGGPAFTGGWALSGSNAADQGLDFVAFSFDTDPTDADAAEDGNSFAQLGNLNPVSLSQTVADTASQTLTLTYYLGTFSGNQFGSNTFSAFWNGSLIAGSSIVDDNTVGYDKFTFNVLSTGSDILAFTFANGQDNFQLDNVSLVAPTVAVPEPATLAMFGAGLLGLAGLYRRRSSKA